MEQTRVEIDPRVREGHARRRRRRRRRLAALAIAGAALALGGGWLLGPGRGRIRETVRAAWFISKIRRGIAVDSDYVLLGKTEVWFAQGVLEEAARGEDDWIAQKALLSLYVHYPESALSAACREYEEIRAGAAVGRGDDWVPGSYFWRFCEERRRSALPPIPLDEETAIAHWESFLERNPGFQGADDAALHLGDALARVGRRVDAARAFRRGAGLGDRDNDWALHRRIARIVDGCGDEADLLELEEDPAFVDDRTTLRYARALLAARAGRFDEAARSLFWIVGELDAGRATVSPEALRCNARYRDTGACDLSPSWHDEALAAFRKDVFWQEDLFRECANLRARANEARAAGDRRTAIACELRIGRRLLGDRHGLSNELFHEAGDPVGSATQHRRAVPRAGSGDPEWIARSRTDLAALAIADAALDAGDLGPRLFQIAVDLRLEALRRVTVEWVEGHRSHFALGSGQEWRARYQAALRSQRRSRRRARPAHLAAFAGGLLGGGAAPSPVAVPAAVGGLAGGAVAGRSHAVPFPPEPEPSDLIPNLVASGPRPVALGALGGLPTAGVVALTSARSQVDKAGADVIAGPPVAPNTSAIAAAPPPAVAPEVTRLASQPGSEEDR